MLAPMNTGAVGVASALTVRVKGKATMSAAIVVEVKGVLKNTSR